MSTDINTDEEEIQITLSSKNDKVIMDKKKINPNYKTKGELYQIERSFFSKRPRTKIQKSQMKNGTRRK